MNPNAHHPTNELILTDSRLVFTLWHFPLPAPTTQSPTIDAKGILDLQAGAGLLTEHRCHAQHILKGEHIVVGEHFADSVSKRVDLRERRRGGRRPMNVRFMPPWPSHIYQKHSKFLFAPSSAFCMSNSFPSTRTPFLQLLRGPALPVLNSSLLASRLYQIPTLL